MTIYSDLMSVCNGRVYIRAEGKLGTARIDQRANSPTFRMTANAMVAGLDLDMSGFRESVLIEGGPDCQPLIYNCIIKCSGDDGINVGGEANPVIHSCCIEVNPSRFSD